MGTPAIANANPIARLIASTIGLKTIMALTGFVWIGFVLGHMVGNLQIFLPGYGPADPELGAHAINKYAAMLKATGGALWVARLVLLGAFVTHVWAAITLARRNKAARPVDYERHSKIQAKASSYYMLISGLMLLAFIIFHLAHFTLGLVQPGAYAINHLDHGLPDVYKMFILGFRNPIFAGGYIISNVLLGLHLHHATSSMFQTLGLRTPKYRRIVDKAGVAIAASATIGNVMMPLAVVLGLIGQSVV
ncbi:MAG TPA: succinate:quinone oxidoreductase [Myxococcales bacterium]|nr:succinate:quinone oxidoreductase [Myxococcales bacterium]